MKRKRIIIACLLTVALLFGFRWFNSPRRNPQLFLKNSDQFIFYSLNPTDYVELPNGGLVKSPKGEAFHNNTVLGKVVITDPTEKATLINSLFDSFKDGATWCHDPRHGIRAIRGNQMMDLTVCFECYNVYFYSGDQDYREQGISLDAKDLFNQTLRKYHLPLAKE